MGYLNRWRNFPGWLFKYGFKSIPVANGAWGMGCIGYPGHPVWEVTGACNLRCIHCHAVSGKAAPDELTTDEGKKLIDMIAANSEFRTLDLYRRRTAGKTGYFRIAQIFAAGRSRQHHRH